MNEDLQLCKIFKGEMVSFIIDPSEGKEGFDMKTSDTAIVGQFESVECGILRVRGPIY
jgi:hypothetical protein